MQVLLIGWAKRGTLKVVVPPVVSYAPKGSKVSGLPSSFVQIAQIVKSVEGVKDCQVDPKPSGFYSLHLLVSLERTVYTRRMVLERVLASIEIVFGAAKPCYVDAAGKQQDRRAWLQAVSQ